MIAFLTIIYVVIIVILFKVLHLKPKPYRIAWIVVVGILALGGIVVGWVQSAPLSAKLVTTQYVVQLVPYVKGQVRAVYAQANQPIKKGDLLLEIDPAPYQYTVDQLDAELKKAKATVDEANAASQNAQAVLEKAKAADELAKTAEQMVLYVEHLNREAISQLRVAQAQQARAEADAAVKQAEAAAQQAAFAVIVAQSAVPAIAAQLEDARFNLAQCKMTAPADGYVVDWQVQVGTMLTSAPVAAAGAFIDTSSLYVVAVFPQNYLNNVRQGDDVELVLDPYPGRLFKGKVDTVIAASGGGQFTTGGTLPTAAMVGSVGAYAVRIRIDDKAVAEKLSMGSGGAATIYTATGKPFHIISKVAIRMKKWLLFVMPSAQT